MKELTSRFRAPAVGLLADGASEGHTIYSVTRLSH
jgi:hypothetical protein